MTTLSGKRVIVTGAGRGLGRSYALAIAAAGGSVIVNDVDEETAHAVCTEIAAQGGIAHPSAHSVTEPDAASAMVDLCVSRFGGLDGLVNNAGLFHVATPLGENLDEVARLIQVNVLGVLNAGLFAIREMSRAGSGTIVNIVSGAALGIKEMGSYGASKGAVLSLTKAWAIDLSDTGIRIMAVSPVADTRMTESLSGAVKPGGNPDDIAPLISYLLSDANHAPNGTVFRLAYGELSLLNDATFGPPLAADSRWTVSTITEALKEWPLKLHVHTRRPRSVDD